MKFARKFAMILDELKEKMVNDGDNHIAAIF